MSDVEGTDIVGGLLRLDAAVIGVVPAEQIKGGALAEDASLPALLVRLVSSHDHQTLRKGTKVHRTDRVRVTVRAASWREVRSVMAAVRRCCSSVTGNLHGAQRVAILPAGSGPDLRGPGNSFERTQDFRVSFDADA